jgi:hypothetical protein
LRLAPERGSHTASPHVYGTQPFLLAAPLRLGSGTRVLIERTKCGIRIAAIGSSGERAPIESIDDPQCQLDRFPRTVFDKPGTGARRR